MQVEKSDVEWLIGLISTWLIALIPYIKTKQKPSHRKLGKKHKR